MKNQTNETYEILRDKILSGEFRPAQRLIESKLAEELGVSRNYIRMAFQRLVTDGLIDIQPNQGATVSDVTLEDILDVFVAREALELEAYKRTFSLIKDARLQQLESLIQNMKRAIENSDYETYSSSATKFREIILETAGSPHLKGLADSLLMITGRVVFARS